MVIDGPFRFTRNPLYIGNVSLAAGIGVVATPFGWLLLVALHVILMHGEIFSCVCFLSMLTLFLPIPFPANMCVFWTVLVVGEL